MQRIDFRDQIARNKRNSFLLMIAIFIVFVMFGYLISMVLNPSYFFIIMSISVVFSLSYILFSYYNSDKIAVASVGAKIAPREKFKDYYNLVEGLTIASGLPMPKLYIMQSSQINAFAAGRNPENAVVCVTTGALEKLDRRELEGVLAHELGHIANYDIRYMTLVTVMVGMIAIISEIFLRSLWFAGRDNRNNALLIIIGLVIAILAPIVVYLIQMAISRKREFSADASAVKFTRYPEGLIRALKKIQHDYSPPSKKVSKAVAPLFFSNPFKSLKSLTSTHPPIEERIKMLERM